MSRVPNASIVPAQVPAKRIRFAVCSVTGLLGDALASGFNFGFGLGDDLSFGLADCSGVGVGVSMSEIGAGNRCVINKQDDGGQ